MDGGYIRNTTTMQQRLQSRKTRSLTSGGKDKISSKAQPRYYVIAAWNRYMLLPSQHQITKLKLLPDFAIKLADQQIMSREDLCSRCLLQSLHALIAFEPGLVVTHQPARRTAVVIVLDVGVIIEEKERASLLQIDL